MKKDEKFIKWIQEQMEFTTPSPLKAMKYHPKGKARQTFFEIVCHKTCLNPNSKDVLKAFNNLYPL